MEVDGIWTTPVLKVTASGGGQGSGQLAGSGTIDLTSGGGLDYNSAAASTFAGDLAGASSNARLEVDGGSLTLSGTNSLQGGAVVTSGKLILTSPSAIATGTSLTVGAGAARVFDSSAIPNAATVIAVTTPVVAGTADRSVATTATSNDTSAGTTSDASAKTAVSIGTTRISSSPILMALKAANCRARPAGSIGGHLAQYGWLDHQRRPSVIDAEKSNGMDRFVWPPTAARTTSDLAWLGQAATNSDNLDQRRTKDVAILALDAVLAQYGR